MHRRGGKRDGAGRPAGSVTVRSRELVEKYLNDGKKLPVDVLMEAMRNADDQKDTDFAVECAKSAAPYFHAKLANMEITGKDGEAIQHEHGVKPEDKDILDRFYSTYKPTERNK